MSNARSWLHVLRAIGTNSCAAATRGWRTGKGSTWGISDVDQPARLALAASLCHWLHHVLAPARHDTAHALAHWAGHAPRQQVDHQSRLVAGGPRPRHEPPHRRAEVQGYDANG